MKTRISNLQSGVCLMRLRTYNPVGQLSEMTDKTDLSWWKAITAL